MNSLRIEADENASKAEELKAKVKALEQENLQKEQEITSLTHRNQLLEGEVEKLETGVKEAKTLAGESAQHGQQNEALTRKLQLLEEEAESSDKTLRETNEKYIFLLYAPRSILTIIDFDKPMSRPATTNAKSKHLNSPETTGKANTRICPRNTRICRRSCRNWSKAWVTSEPCPDTALFESLVHTMNTKGSMDGC